MITSMLSQKFNGMPIARLSVTNPACLYGWTYGEPEEFITILELPPVTDAQSAVKVGVSCQIKKARKTK